MSKKIFTQLTLAFVLFFSLGAFNAQGQATPTIKTDLLDYPPGSTAIITGTGFQPNETVTLQVLHVDGDSLGTDPQYHQPFTAIADGDGNVSSTWFVPNDGDALGANFKLTADGQSSGRYAEWFFTDGNKTTTTITSGTNPSTYGNSVTFTVTVTNSVSVSPTGSVTIRDGGTDISGNLSFTSTTSNSSSLSYTISTLFATTHIITADYNSNNNSSFNNSSSSNLSQVVNKRSITVTAQTNSKPYDGNNSAAATPTITSGTLAGSDVANFSETYNNKNVGTGKTLTPAGTVTDGNSGNNYAYTFVINATGAIAAKALTATSTVASKAYDGSATTGTITLGPITGLAGTETLVITPSASAYSSVNVGSYSTTISYSLADGTNGGLASNYSMASLSTTGSITPKALTATSTIASKVYEGTTTVTGTITVGTVTGYVGTQTLTITPSASALSSANVGTRNTTISYSLADGTNGGVAANYSMASLASTEVITAKPLTPASTIASKVYDGTTTVTGTITVGTVTGYVGTQTLTITP